MGPLLSPPKVVLLAVHFAAHADIDGLASLASQHRTTLRNDLVLRILLTHLPETVRPTAYTGFLQQLAADELVAGPEAELDTSPVQHLSDDQATTKVRKLHLLPLACPDTPEASHDDSLSLFLFHRAYRVDEEAGLLTQLPDLFTPFLQYAPAIRIWSASTLIPLVRRNSEYYAESAAAYSLRDFQRLPDVAAVDYLLAHTGHSERDNSILGRDLRGLIAPWLHNDARWGRSHARDPPLDSDAASPSVSCPGWEHVLGWLVLQATRSWRASVGVIEQWDGPGDVDWGGSSALSHPKPRQQYLDGSYVRAALAAAYLLPEATIDALNGAHQISSKASSLLGGNPPLPLDVAASELSPVHVLGAAAGTGSASYMRNELLQPNNPLTSPSTEAIEFLGALILSAFLSTRIGSPCTVKKAGELALLRDPRDQKAEVSRLIRAISNHASRSDDNYWERARREVLWLHDWSAGNVTRSEAAVAGIFALVPKEYTEAELLKALLLNSRYMLAAKLYEESAEKPLAAGAVQDTVCHCALNAFDNATNPNRTRGGLRRCDDIIHAFPVTVPGTHPARRRIEALLRATHALSDYRLVLKQGEPFSPVVLRVHSDPISIIGKVLEQNPGAYTRFQEFLEMGVSMIQANLTANGRPGKPSEIVSEQPDNEILVAEKRIVSMCIEAALAEDDFETAYSYVVSRLDSSSSDREEEAARESWDQWSWRAALKAGQYIRTARSQQPTHLGTASGNLEIRHLEQRIECLATALRVAPPSQLQEILKTFRRCEEQLDSAVKDEAAKEAAWDAAADMADLPGAFDTADPDKAYPPRNMTATVAARQGEEAPMSLFDLSRATAGVAHKNFSALSSLQGITQGIPHSQGPDPNAGTEPRVRKRDQLRDAATGTLVSGVGWLIGANVNRDGDPGPR